MLFGNRLKPNLVIRHQVNLNILGLTHQSRNDEPLQAQRSRTDHAPQKKRSLSHTPSVGSFPNYLILPELYTVQLAAKSVNFRLYGALKPKTISCLGTPASTNSLATPISVPSRSIQILPSLIST